MCKTHLLTLWPLTFQLQTVSLLIYPYTEFEHFRIICFELYCDKQTDRQTNKQTNRRPRTPYPCRPTESAWVIITTIIIYETLSTELQLRLRSDNCYVSTSFWSTNRRSSLFSGPPWQRAQLTLTTSNSQALWIEKCFYLYLSRHGWRCPVAVPMFWPENAFSF